MGKPVTGRPKIYNDAINITVSMERQDVALLDSLRRDIPRGRYISMTLRGTEEHMQKILDLEATVRNYLLIIDKDNALARSNDATFQSLKEQLSVKDAEINKLTAQVQRLTEQIELLRMQPAPTTEADKRDIDKTSDEIETMRKEFMDRNYPILYGFIKNRISNDNLIGFQRQLLFPTLPKLKTYLMEEYHRRVRAGLMPATEEPIKPAAPQLTPEQQAYKDELAANIKELRTKLERVRKEVNAAVERGDVQVVNTLGPQEHMLEDQLLEAMKTAKAAGETGFNRPVTQPEPSPAPEEKVETSPGIQENNSQAFSTTPASSTTYEGKTASEMLAKVREWDKQEKAAVDSPSPTAGDTVKGADWTSALVDAKLDPKVDAQHDVKLDRVERLTYD
jgi:outer membrane murein-binding lipoprotein Lpp